MTPSVWVTLVKRLNELACTRPELACLLITHGTDTMEETAFFLDQTYKGKTPVVIVGAMRSANAVSADGPANLLDGLRVGLHPDACDKGILVVLNNAIHAAVDLTKTDNLRVQTFAPTEKGFLGAVDVAGVRFFRSPTHPHTIASPFTVKSDGLPEVDLLRDYAGLPEEVLAFFAERPTEGLVIETFAGGRTSRHVTDQVQSWDGNKIIVLASSLRGSRLAGSISEIPGVVLSPGLPANKARILLMLCLQQNQSAQEIQATLNQF